MAVNKYQPHLLVLPEDDANRQMANGFLLHPNLNHRVIQVLPTVGGWQKVLEKFLNEYVSDMQRFPQRSILLLIDFDGQEERLDYIQNQIPQDIRKRVFVLGVQSEPEDLQRTTQQSLEAIGETLAKDCANNTNDLWGCELLQHNAIELERLILHVKPYLFDET